MTRWRMFVVGTGKVVAAQGISLEVAQHMADQATKKTGPLNLGPDETMIVECSA